MRAGRGGHPSLTAIIRRCALLRRCATHSRLPSPRSTLIIHERRRPYLARYACTQTPAFPNDLEEKTLHGSTSDRSRYHDHTRLTPPLPMAVAAPRRTPRHASAAQLMT